MFPLCALSSHCHMAIPFWSFFLIVCVKVNEKIVLTREVFSSHESFACFLFILYFLGVTDIFSAPY